MKITVAKLKALDACDDGVEWFAKQNCTDLKQVVLKAIATKNMKILRYASWGLAKFLNRMNKIKYAIFVAEQVIDIFEKKYPDDKRPREAIEAAKKYLKSPTKKNRNAADAAYAVADAAYAKIRIKGLFKLLKYGVKLIK